LTIPARIRKFNEKPTESVGVCFGV